MQAVELARIEPEQWRALQGDEPHPWGGEAETLSWADKTHHVGVPGRDGGLLGHAGALVAEVSAGGERFAVAGVGGVIVRPDMRGQGLARALVEAILEVSQQLGPERAMLFCRERLVPMYERFGFRLIAAPVTAAQPDGRIEMPMRAMWKPLYDGVEWPAGAVEVLREPF